LLAALWAELEAITAPNGAVAGDHAAESDGSQRAALSLRQEVFLLELALLWERCESLRQRGWLRSEQAHAMRSLIAEVRGLLEFDPLVGSRADFGASVVYAQNRLFEEVQRIALDEEDTVGRRAG
jgi:hypothetical protein